QIRRDPTAEAALQSVLKIDPEHREALRHLAHLLGRHASTIDRALEVWERLAQLDPEVVFPLVHRARALARAGRLDQAEAEFRRALERSAEHPMALGDLARFYRVHRQYNNAIEIYQAYLRLEPERMDAILGIGQCLDRLNRLDEAQAYYDMALALDAE